MNWYKKQLKIAFAAPRGWSSKELAEMERLVNQGKSFLSIAKMFGVNSHTIERLNKKYQWRDLVEYRRKKDEYLASLYLLPPRGKGMTAQQITKQYGTNLTTVFKALERLNLLDQWRGRSEAARKKFIDHPELVQEHSIKMKQRIEDMGGFEGMLLNCSTRDKAIAMLNHNSRRIGGESSERAFNVYNKYKQIIDNHTFPDEVPQGTTI